MVKKIERMFAVARTAGAAVWLALSIAGLAGMLFTLWWQRDVALYAGKSPDEQRVEVFKRAGLNPALVGETMKLARAWPEHVSYSLSGGGDNQSYVKYLLAPRIPSGDARRSAVISGDLIQVVSPTGEPGGAPAERAGWKPGWILSLAITLALGYLLSRALPRRARLSVPEMAGLATLLVSGALTVSRVLTGSVGSGAIAVTALGALGGILMVSPISRALRSVAAGFPRSPGRRPGTDTLWISGCAAVIAGGVLLSFLLSVIVVPDDWDAWAIWGAKAKVLALGTGPLSDVTHFGHADYPLLWPSLWAFSALCCGGWEEQLCRGWGAVFLLLAAWQIGVVTARRSGSRGAGVFAAALFVSIPKVVVVASWSYAEGPLWLLTVCCLGRTLESAETGGWENPLLAGLFATASAYTKNDGLLLAVLGFAWLVLFCPRGRTAGPALVYAAVLAAGYGPWFAWTRLELGLASHATEGLSLSAALVSHARARLPAAVAAVGRMWSDVRQWSVVPIVVFAAGFSTLRASERRSRAAVTLPLAALLTFFSIVVLHRADVTWQVSTSWDRLTIQVLALTIPAVVPALHRWVGGTSAATRTGPASPAA